ncbi:methyl-accepting chemotaxis protein [Mobilisporobacter senegalensis]|uniref:Methyl-accepting chemotaxis protein n=1 Tax=Mobilisporobacter senegalensis TaxID=1329262 RepID=A0A3N1XV34_9FIRM|nr:methyl-accepting chemotaxis protein [Mobilisporobacter senegalensis]ROR30456.1 methyl-accepting chemotaxis protein [Mobilisporobacter senegalensis]
MKMRLKKTKDKSKVFPKIKKNGSKKNFKETFKFASIRIELIGSFLIPVILIIALGIVSYTKASDGMISNFENSSLMTLDMMSEYYELGFKGVTSNAVQLNNSETLQDYYSGDFKNNSMAEENQYKTGKNMVVTAAVSEEFINDIYVIGSYGKSMSANSNFKSAIYKEFIDSTEGKTFMELNQGEIWLGEHKSIDASVTKTSKDYFMSLVRRFSVTGKELGYIVIDISNDAILKLLDKTDFGQGSISGVITQDGKEVLKGNYPQEYSFASQSFYIEAQKSADTSGLEYVKFNNKSYLFIFKKMETGNTMICSLIPETEVLKQAESVKIITLILVALGVIIALGIGTFMASGISRTIKMANEKLKLVADGDLTVDIKIKRKDEFNILGKSINNMFSSMKILINKMISVSNTTTNSANEVSEASGTLLKTSENIAMAVADIEEGVHQQANDAENCLIQMSGLAQQINSVYENTNEIGESANNTRKSVNDGIIIIDTLSANAKDTSNITQLVIKNIQELNIESKAIAGIIGSINDIAEQTNLLSLNASIEAARAGEAGRGFAVVADEIRKLAVQSAQAASQIGTIIEQIGNKTGKTVEAAKQAGEIVGKQENTLADTITVFQVINKQVEKLTGNLSEISKGIEKIEQAKNDTLGAVESISATSEETAAASTQLGISAESQLKAVEMLNLAAVRLSEDANNLQETANIFKIH